MSFSRDADATKRTFPILCSGRGGGGGEGDTNETKSFGLLWQSIQAQPHSEGKEEGEIDRERERKKGEMRKVKALSSKESKDEGRRGCVGEENVRRERLKPSQ